MTGLSRLTEQIALLLNTTHKYNSMKTEILRKIHRPAQCVVQVGLINYVTRCLSCE